MKKHTILLALLFISATTFAQSKFGSATKEELEMTSYKEDSVAPAVILSKKGELIFIFNDNQGNFQYEYEIEKKIKILNQEGLEYANGAIDYYIANRTNKENITNLSGTTYNLENGKIVKTKLSKEHIFDEDVEGKLKRKKFTMPAAKVGSIIEYKYKIVSDFVYELNDFYFQEDIPVDYVDLEVTIPEYFNYNLNQQGYVQLENTPAKSVNQQFHISY